MIIDAWEQHPTLCFSQAASRAARRWTRAEALRDALPVAATVAAMDEGLAGPSRRPHVYRRD